MSDVKQVLKVRRYKVGYEARIELIDGSEFGCPDFEMKSAYTPEGYYIGDSKTAHRLCKLRGIKPQPRNPKRPAANNGRGRTCTIGFSEREQKWYGWSHRAIYGFGIGSTVEDEDHVCAGRLGKGFEAKTLVDARRMAEVFAEAVGKISGREDAGGVAAWVTSATA